MGVEGICVQRPTEKLTVVHRLPETTKKLLQFAPKTHIPRASSQRYGSISQLFRNFDAFYPALDNLMHLSTQLLRRRKPYAPLTSQCVAILPVSLFF